MLNWTTLDYELLQFGFVEQASCSQLRLCVKIRWNGPNSEDLKTPENLFLANAKKIMVLRFFSLFFGTEHGASSMLITHYNTKLHPCLCIIIFSINLENTSIFLLFAHLFPHVRCVHIHMQHIGCAANRTERDLLMLHVLIYFSSAVIS